MNHMPGLTAHLVSKVWSAKLFANPCPREFAFVFAKDRVDLFTQLGEGLHPSTEEYVSPASLSASQREHVRIPREKSTHLRLIVPVC